MDKKVCSVLQKYLKKGVNLDDLQSELINANCVIYHSELPPITGQAIQYVDGTPNEDYPLRILRSYRQQCDCMWAESITGEEPLNPLLKMMNDQNRHRGEILDRAMKKLSAP